VTVKTAGFGDLWLAGPRAEPVVHLDPNQALSPLIDRDRFLVVGFNNPPVAVCLATHHDDVNILETVRVYPLIRCCFEHRSPRLLSEGSSRIDIVLYELIVPELTSGQGGIFLDPLNQLLLGIEPPPFHELPRCYGIQYIEGQIPEANS